MGSAGQAVHHHGSRHGQRHAQPLQGGGRSPKRATDTTMGTSTPSRVNTEERMAPFLWMLYPLADREAR